MCDCWVCRVGTVAGLSFVGTDAGSPGDAAREPGQSGPGGRRRPDDDPIETEAVRSVALPPAVSERLQSLFGTDAPPATLGEWIDALHLAVGADGGRALTVGMLCHAEESRHRARTADGEYAFHCVLDAVMLPFMGEGPVEVTTVDPVDDTEIAIDVTADGIEWTPEDAVLSFGVRSVSRSGDPGLPVLYGAMCRYVNAFAGRESYDRWAAEVDAETMPLSVPEGFALARALTGRE